jgi:protein ImuB
LIPSYDDLTPGIPDVLDSESVNQLALFLRDDLKRKVPAKDPSTAKKDPASERSAIALYACLRGSPPAFAEATARQALMAVARDFSPRVMVVSEREVLLDVSGLGRLIGEPPAIARALARAVYDAGLKASVALGPTQTVARLLATQWPLDGVRGRSDDPMTQLPHLPVTLLQPLETLPPAMHHRDRARPYETRDAKRLYEILARWGIATLGDLTALPAAALSSRLGRRGVALQRLARGLDPRPFVPDPDTPRYISRLELEWPLDALEPLSFVFARLLDPLSAALERADRGAAAIRLDLRLTTRETHARVLQLPAPMRDARVLRTLLLLDLESHPPFGAAREGPSDVMIDIVSIELDPVPARITQFSLLERAVPSPETLSTLTARLSALVGAARIGSAVLVDSHQPGAFEMTPYAPVNGGAYPGTRDLKVAPTGREADTSAPLVPAFPRPVGATFRSRVSGLPVLRRQRTPPAIRVSVEHGRPVYLAASRRGMPQGAVLQAAGPWRTSGGWWALPWSRDEWDVALRSGTVCRIFQDRTTERWFLDGIYD